VCTLAAVLATRIVACWRQGEQYLLRDYGREITEAEGQAICAERHRISAAVRQARRNGTKAKQFKKRAGRGSKESTKAAPASSPPEERPTAVGAAVVGAA
jgi:hypothetical protein